MKNYYAHSLENQPLDNWQPLDTHLKNVAALAADFAEAFSARELAFLAGIWHDLGKYSPEFQAKLLKENGFEIPKGIKPGKVIHSSAGGWLAIQKGWIGYDRVLSWLIMGHHAGLADYASADGAGAALEVRMKDWRKVEELLPIIPEWIKDQSKPSTLFPGDPAMFIRMLYSCLVDADFLDTEHFMDPKKHSQRRSDYPGLPELLQCFDRYMDVLVHDADPTFLNRIRNDVLEQCRADADGDPAVFSLTVPTGGGKTLASMAFALRHAVKHEKRRIIYVIPYTTIIEQTAEVFRSIPGFGDAVLEHHCNVVRDEDDESVESHLRLASENWDAPIVVTTNVQFFESLYASKSSRCRKLHNIAQSVVIFDEAHLFPPKFLKPVVAAIRELHATYQVTPVLCTATQPVLTARKSVDFCFEEGFDPEQLKEMVESPQDLSRDLERVRVGFHPLWPEKISWRTLADDLLAESGSVLCIVNRKDDCRRLWRLLSESVTAYHLSTNMCAQHRHVILNKIRDALKSEQRIIVVSTSLVEAGVDVDFPVVYREIAGLDSIAQAAGRCNREGKLADLGRTVVFQSDSKTPGYMLQPASITRELVRDGDCRGLLRPDLQREYFNQRYWMLGSDRLDANGVLGCFTSQLNFAFRKAAQSFRIIEDSGQTTVIVPYEKAMEIVDELVEQPWNARRLMRKLQRYTVSLYERELKNAERQGFIGDIPKMTGVMMLNTVDLYDDFLGYVPPDDWMEIDPEKYIS